MISSTTVAQLLTATVMMAVTSFAGAQQNYPTRPVRLVVPFPPGGSTDPTARMVAQKVAETGVHLVGELFNMLAGTKLRHIPYKGSGPLLTDVINGTVQVTFPVPIAVTGFIKSGKLRMLAITGEKRLGILSQVPTFAESGMSGFERAAWMGIVAPTGTPKGVIDKISNDVSSVLLVPDLAEKMSAQGQEPFVSTPQQVNMLIRADIAKYAKIIKAANIRVE